MFNFRYSQPINFETLCKTATAIVGSLEQMKNLYPKLEKEYENLISGHVLDLLREISRNNPEDIDNLQRRVSACRLNIPRLESIASLAKADYRVLLDLSKNSSLYFLAIDQSLTKLDSTQKDKLTAEQAFGKFFRLSIEDRRFYVISIAYINESANRFCELLEETRCKQTEGQEKCRDIALSKSQNGMDVELEQCTKAFNKLLPSETEFAELREWAEAPSVTADSNSPSFDVNETIVQLRKANRLMHECQNTYQEFCEILQKWS